MPDGWSTKQIRGRIDPGSPNGAPKFNHWPKPTRTTRYGPAAIAAAESLIGIKRRPGENGYRRSPPRVAWDDRGARLRQQGLHLSGQAAHGHRPDQRREDARKADGGRRRLGRISSADSLGCNLQADRAGLEDRIPGPHAVHPLESDATRIEEIAVHEIETLLDPALPADERERRIRRLTEGPPEFSHERIDLPKDSPKLRT